MDTKNAALLLVHKETNMTSFDVLRRLKRILGRTDLGHGGTLDRFASGLLPVFLGEGLKLSRFLFESYPALPVYWKNYQGTIRFGTATDTADLDGEVIATKPIPALDEKALQEVFASFINTSYLQKPPVYSAKKINGTRASDLARAGKEPDLKPVSVHIRAFTLTSVSKNSEGQIEEAQFEVSCSKGTYVRVLATDVAEKLGTVAHLKTLVRTQVGPWPLASAVTLGQLEALVGDGAAQTAYTAQTMHVTHSTQLPYFLTLSEAASFLPAFPLLEVESVQLETGRVSDTCARLSNSGLPANAYCAVSTDASSVAPVPRALLELTDQSGAKFLRAFLPV